MQMKEVNKWLIEGYMYRNSGKIKTMTQLYWLSHYFFHCTNSQTNLNGSMTVSKSVVNLNLQPNIHWLMFDGVLKYIMPTFIYNPTSFKFLS